MTRTLPLLALSLALAACSDAQEPADPAVEDAAAQEAEDDAPAIAELDLSGAWSISDFRGAANISTHAITVRFPADQMVLTSACIEHVYSLDRTGNIIAPEEVSARTCPNGLAPAEVQLKTSLPQFNILLQRSPDTLNFSGPGGSMTLTRESGEAAAG